MKMNYSLNFEDLQYQAVPLPEEILKMKWSGNFDKAREMINHRLTLDLPKAYRARLMIELKNLNHMEEGYSLSREDALAQVRAEIPDFTEEEFEERIMNGKLEWIFLNGKMMFYVSTIRNMLRTSPELWPRMGGDPKAKVVNVMDAVIENLKDGDRMHGVIHVRHELKMNPDALVPGKNLHVYLPVPVERQQIHNLEILEITPTPTRMPQVEDVQPTAYFELPAEADQVFAVEYKFDNFVDYIDMANIDFDAVAAAEYPEDVKVYLEERGPHILFTPYLRALAEELKGDETHPVKIARRFYDYITTQLAYSFVRDYSAIDSIAEYTAIRRQADCGAQGLLFITLCRIAGIPARWQSGLETAPNDVGEHDWAQFYVPTIGWVYCDPSFGMSAYLRGQMKKWDFYFGNLDPFRCPLNCDVQYDFVPPKKFIRMDICDNQDGEMEYDDYGLYNNDYKRTFIDKGIHLVEPMVP